jgi:hypothetical protein
MQISSEREYENVQGLEDEGAWMRQNSTFQICEAFIDCKNKKLQGSCYNLGHNQNSSQHRNLQG